jgi:L-alanine-DL-glutamate epimerase-like enolase superfamily enzyme
VTALETAVYVIPTDAPEADGTLAWDKTTMVLVTARAGDEQGFGWSYASAAAQTVITEMLADLVTGRSALDTAGTAEAMARQVRNIGRPGVAAMAISAVDIALWDLKARLLGQPLAGLLGLARQDMPVYGSGGFTSYDDTRTRQQLSEWVENERIPRVKIKIGESWGGNERRDLARAELAREVIGPDTELGAVDCLQLDVTRCGGITEFLRGAALAAAHQLQVSGHCAPNLHAHVGAAVPNLRHVEYFHDHQRIERLFFDGALDPAGGVMRPDLERPGHGLALRRTDTERYRCG